MITTAIVCVLQSPGSAQQLQAAKYRCREDQHHSRATIFNHIHLAS